MGSKRFWSKKKRFALIGVAVAVLVVVGWLKWPERPKDLTIHLKCLGNQVWPAGKTLESKLLFLTQTRTFLFRLQGADGYDVFIVPGSVYVCGEVRPRTVDLHKVELQVYSEREFFLEPRQYYSFASNQTWKLQADIVVLPHGNKSNLARFFLAVKEASKISISTIRGNSKHPPFLTTVKFIWNDTSKHPVSMQTISSELITNTTITSELITDTTPH